MQTNFFGKGNIAWCLEFKCLLDIESSVLFTPLHYPASATNIKDKTEAIELDRRSWQF